jgi:hypothetical protein
MAERIAQAMYFEEILGTEGTMGYRCIMKIYDFHIYLFTVCSPSYYLPQSIPFKSSSNEKFIPNMLCPS